MTAYSIGQVAKMVGIPAKTIRFYEAEGLLAPPERAQNGYRAYSERSVEELRVLKYARDLGLPLAEIKKLWQGCAGGDCAHSREYVQTTIDNYLQRLDEQIGELQLLRLRLNELTGRLAAGHCETYCCDILHQLSEVSVEKGGP